MGRESLGAEPEHQGDRVGPEREPLDIVPPGQADFWSSRWVAQAALGFVALGVMLRLSRYLLHFPLWCDETMIAANFLDRGYFDLLRPLDYRQVGPLLWLAVELTSVRVFGFSEWSLRLFPAACAVASVPLFYHVARRVLSGVPLLLAVAIFAVSSWPLRYAGEVKPYASDLFVSLGLLALAIEWWRRPDQTRWLGMLALAAPVAVAISLPAVFIVGGVGLALVGPVWRARVRPAIVALGLMGLGCIVMFLSLARFYKTAPQDHDYFHNAWAEAFPPLQNPLRTIFWFFDVNTGYMFAYPEGTAHGGSVLTFLCFVIAAVVLWRRGRRVVVGLCLAPFGLALAAAAIHRYPYGISARTSQYAVPMICLLAGLGLAQALSRLTVATRRRRALEVVTLVLAFFGIARLGLDMAQPFKTASDQQVRAFAHWFWTEMARDGEVACLKNDLGIAIDPKHWTEAATDTYLCYQRIYSPRHRRRAPLDLRAVSAKHPLRVVMFNEFPQGRPVFEAWLARMRESYELLRVVPYPVHSLERKLGVTWDQMYLVYEFVPRASPALAVAPRVEPPQR